MTNWKTEMTWLTILYRMLECKEAIPVITDGTSYEFVENDLEELAAKELIKINVETSNYQITEKGQEICKQLLGMYDQVIKFETFSSVNVTQVLDEDDIDDEGNLHPQLYDLRFQKPGSIVEQEELGTEDLRIGMMSFLSEEMDTDNKLDPHRIVFLQMLSTGKFKSENIWFDLSLGEMFGEIEEIVKLAYQWEDTADSEEDARQAMISIYTAGMIESRKRDGRECGGCNIPLAIFEMWKKEDGKTLDNCPGCEATFNPPLPEYNCPVCGDGVTKGQVRCSCGAILDFSMPPGTIQTETEEEIIEEPVWSYDYGYCGTPYMDPYDPFLDAVAFGTVCAVLW